MDDYSSDDLDERYCIYNTARGLCGNLPMPGTDLCPYHSEIDPHSPLPFASEDESSDIDNLDDLEVHDKVLALARRQALNNPICTLDEHTLRGLLTRDWLARSMTSWRLLFQEEMEKCWKDTVHLRQRKFRECPEPDFDPVSTPEMGDFYTINRTTGDLQVLEFVPWEVVERDAIENIDDNFPGVTLLLKTFEGKLVAAGGAIFKALVGSDDHNDIDLFFIDPEVERTDVSDQAKTQKATGQLFEMIAFLVDWWFRLDTGGADHEHSTNVYVTRNEFVVSLYLVSGTVACKFQFILRVYPSIGHVLGGFDLGPAMVAFDGTNILATELGAWSALGRILIVDISRRSTSFEHRIQKYSYHCHVVLPGLSRRTVPDETKSWSNKEETVAAIEAHVKKSGHRWGVTNLKDCLNADYGPKHGFVKIAPRMEESKAKELLQNMAAECGYIIPDFQLSPAYPEEEVNFDQDLDDEAVDELYMGIKDLAFEKGYVFSRDSYQYARGTKYYAKHSYLTRRPRILRLAMAEIGLKYADVPRHAMFAFRPRKDPRIEYEINDYDGQDMLIVKEGIGLVQPSDYEDSKVWPTHTVGANLSMILTDNLKAVVSVMAFMLQSGTLVSKGGSDIYTINALTPCIFKIDQSHPTVKMTRKDTILYLLQRNERDPDIGPVDELFKTKMKLLSTEEEDQVGDGFKRRVFGQAYYNNALYRMYQTKDALDRLEPDFRRRLADIKHREKMVKQNLVGIRWILRNPGTQWTSSLNPTIGDPREWYGDEYYRSWRIGCEEIETTLRLIRRRPGNPLHEMDYNIFRVIVRKVIWAQSLLPNPQLAVK